MADYSIQKAYSWAVQTCNAPNVGYSQALRNQGTSGGITYYDCSSFIWYALINGGWPMAQLYGSSWPFVTADLRPVLLRAGFVEMPIDSTEWKPGDIVLRILGEVSGRVGHVEMVYQSNGVGSGYTMGAHTDEVPLADQVSIYTFPQSGADFRHLFRFGDGADPDTGYGCSEYVVAAICGNWKREGIMNPGQWEFGKPMAPPWDAIYPEVGGHGLGGWTNVSGSLNLLNLHNYCLEHGYDDNSGPGQLECFINEPWWNRFSAAAEYEDLDAFLHSTSTDLDQLVHAFYNGWEGLPDDWEYGGLELRKQYAAWALNIIRTRANDTSITDWKVLVTNTSSLSEADQANNVIMVFRYLSAGGGGGGTPWKRQGMPIWMMVKYF